MQTQVKKENPDSRQKNKCTFLTPYRCDGQTARWETAVCCWCWLQTDHHTRPMEERPQVNDFIVLWCCTTCPENCVWKSRYYKSFHKHRQASYLDISWETLCSQTWPQEMWQDLQFDSCAYWLVLQLLLHIAALMHTGVITYNSIQHLGKFKG